MCVCVSINEIVCVWVSMRLCVCGVCVGVWVNQCRVKMSERQANERKVVNIGGERGNKIRQVDR